MRDKGKNRGRRGDTEGKRQTWKKARETERKR